MFKMSQQKLVSSKSKKSLNSSATFNSKTTSTKNVKRTSQKMSNDLKETTKLAPTSVLCERDIEGVEETPKKKAKLHKSNKSTKQVKGSKAQIMNYSGNNSYEEIDHSFSKNPKANMKSQKISKNLKETTKLAPTSIDNDIEGDSSDEEIEYSFSKTPNANSTVANKSQKIPHNLKETNKLAPASALSDSDVDGDSSDEENISFSKNPNDAKSNKLHQILNNQKKTNKLIPSSALNDSDSEDVEETTPKKKAKLHKSDKAKESNTQIKEYKSSEDSSDEENVDYSFSKTPDANSTVAKPQKIPNNLKEKCTSSSALRDIEEPLWPKSDLLKLIGCIKAKLPLNDKNSYLVTKKKLSWDMIKFGSYTAQQCEKQWTIIEKHVRTLRLLSELLDEATTLVNSGKLIVTHPNRPKKPLGIFFQYLAINKKKLQRLYPGLKASEITKLAATKFYELSQEEKAILSSRVKEEQRIYKQKMEEFYLDHPEQKQMKKFYVPETPMHCFITDKIGRNIDYGELKHLKAQFKDTWNNLSGDLKYPWIKLVVEHEKELLEQHDGVGKFRSKLTKSEKKIYTKRFLVKPTKPPSLLMFYKTLLGEDYKTSSHTSLKASWQELSLTKKNEYTEKHNEILRKYNEEYDAYLKKANIKDISKTEYAKINNLNISQTNNQKRKSKLLTREEMLAKEPLQPSLKPFDLFADKAKALGVISAHSIQKKWNKLSEQEKNEYELQLESMKQKYILDYKNFLSSLKPAELQLFSKIKGNKLHGDEDEDQSSSNEEEKDNQNNENEEKPESTDDDDTDLGDED